MSRTLTPMGFSYLVPPKKTCDFGTNICFAAPAGSTTMPRKKPQVNIMNSGQNSLLSGRKQLITGDFFISIRQTWTPHYDSLADTIASRSNTFG